jgi:hypothetical protein
LSLISTESSGKKDWKSSSTRQSLCNNSYITRLPVNLFISSILGYALDFLWNFNDSKIANLLTKSIFWPEKINLKFKKFHSLPKYFLFNTNAKYCFFIHLFHEKLTFEWFYVIPSNNNLCKIVHITVWVCVIFSTI